MKSTCAFKVKAWLLGLSKQHVSEIARLHRRLLAAGICCDRSRLQVKSAAQNDAWLCTTGETVWGWLFPQQPAHVCAALTPDPSLQNSIVFPRQVPSRMEQGCREPV